MSYRRLLMKIVSESGLSSKEIIEECNKRGRKIDKAYFSKLLNGKVPPPSEELSRMLANVCNVDERLLVIEGYIEKAPKEIKEAFISAKAMVYMITTSIFENKVEEKMYGELQKKLQEEPLSEFIISLIDEQPDDIKINKDGLEFSKLDEDNMDFKFKLEEPLSLTVNDNGMFPKIEKGSKIILRLEEKYENGDILAIKSKDKEDIMVRFVFMSDNKIILIPLDKHFNKRTYNLQDVTILGKVVKVITDL